MSRSARWRDEGIDWVGTSRSRRASENELDSDETPDGLRQGRSGRMAFRAEGETAAKKARLAGDFEPLGLFDDAPVTGGAERCANSKDVLALDDAKRLIEDDRRERKALKKDKKRSLREGQQKVHQNPSGVLLVCLKGVGALRCSEKLSAPRRKRQFFTMFGNHWRPREREDSPRRSSSYAGCAHASAHERQTGSRWAPPRLGSSRHSSRGKRLQPPSIMFHLSEHVVASRKGDVHRGRGYRRNGDESAKKGCGPLVSTIRRTGPVCCSRWLGACETSGTQPESREQITSSKKKKSARLPRSSETKLASSPTSTLRKVLEKHRGTYFTKEGWGCSPDGSPSSRQRRQSKRSRLSGPRARKCGVGPESEFDVAALACRLWQRAEPEQRNAEVETEVALLVTEGALVSDVRNTVDGRAPRTCCGKSKQPRPSPSWPFELGVVFLEGGYWRLGLRGSSFPDSHPDGLPQPRKHATFSQNLQLNFTKHCRLTVRKLGSLKRSAAHWTLLSTSGSHFFYEILDQAPGGRPTRDCAEASTG